ncbi:MAG: M24 family metallopeptidase [Bacteroidetes bacterium]|nr:M24 family metallopeptidase [Bacteroidota bacterium]MBU2584660.1 M24 family metallopeptidase [Bacteroidota bacterium]
MKKYLSLIVILLSFVFFTCQIAENKEDIECKKLIWKNEPSHPLTQDEIKEEINIKFEWLKKFLDENKLSGMLFTQVRNVNWITAGLANNQIVLNKDIGAASVLIKKDGKKYLICNGAEAGRMMDESLKDLGYELKMFNWYESNPVKDVRGEIIKQLAGTGIIGSDIDYPSTINVSAKFKSLRYSLTESEIKRYRWLGEQTTEAVAEICKRIKPGMNEFEIEAMTAAELRSRGILPTVLLIGVDDRIYKYRHALPGGAVLQKYAMVNVVAEKWGMPIAVTRFVYFGDKLPDELKNKLEKTAIVNAHFQLASVPGKSMEEIWEGCKKWYANVGFENEWMKHHQGGAIGYDDREYVIWPGNNEVVQENQAFAWNPTITGAKVEETIIVRKDGFEVVTKSKDWPMINVELNSKIYPQPGILLKNPSTGKIIEQKDHTIKP